MTLVDPTLLEILRCPVCRATVREDEQESVLICTADSSHRYPVEDGIPNMIPPAD